MPNRIIREKARSSGSLDRLSDGAERTFWRLTTTADDYGRFEADPRIVLAACYPLRVDDPDRRRRISLETIRRQLRELGEDLVAYYQVGGRLYGVFRTWRLYQTTRAKESKHPDPPPDADSVDRRDLLTDANRCKQTPAHVSEIGNGIENRESRSRSESETPTLALDDRVEVLQDPGRRPEDPIVLSYPVVGHRDFGGPSAVWNLTESVLRELRALYPGTDVYQEAKRALAWILANPTRRKTSSGYRRFLTGWIDRTVNSGPRSPTQVPTEPRGYAGIRAALGKSGQTLENLPSTIAAQTIDADVVGGGLES